VGILNGSLTSIGSTLAAAIRIGRRTIHVPYSVPYFASSFRNYGVLVPPSMVTVVYAYVGGFPHALLAANIAPNDTSCTLAATDGGSGLFGVYPGTSMEIVDKANTERFIVNTVVGNVITPVTPFTKSHTIPQAPDFITVTSVPPGVRLASSYLTTALLKTRGDSSISLEELTQPSRLNEEAGDLWRDIKFAKDLLKPYTVRMKDPR
jgi:hypothetical protein